MRHAITLPLIGALTASAAATPVLLEVDSTLSNVEVEIEIAGGVLSDTDSSSLSGFFRLDLDSVTVPGSASLRNFRLVVDDDLHLQDSVFLVGGFTTTITDAVFSLAPPPPAIAPVTPTGETVFAEVNSAAEGAAAYTVTGAACSLLGGRPCNDTVDLADSGPSEIESFASVLQINNGVVTFTASLAMSMPLDPDNPSSGTLRVEGDLVARGAACAADINRDGVIDADDFFAFLALFASGDPRADLSGAAAPLSPDFLVPDGVIDADDFFAYLHLFATGCP